jgi:hypothetical protein
VDLRQIQGLYKAKEGLSFAAIGRHHALMIGSPGTGKTPGNYAYIFRGRVDRESPRVSSPVSQPPSYHIRNRHGRRRHKTHARRDKLIA